ncbi:hypothetical protein [Streptomyces collinus]|uniref:hypothetical protein n=1 Tax=Streptomyces collinus TaxID=42684 RepID=UPI0036855A36
MTDKRSYVEVNENELVLKMFNERILLPWSSEFTEELIEALTPRVMKRNQELEELKELWGL